MLQIDRVEKADEKNGVICVVFMFPSWILCWAKKSKYIKAIYICASKMSHYALWENCIIMLWLNILEILVFEIG